jgi:hypothetical protein
MRDVLAFMLLAGVVSLAFFLAVRAPESDVFKILLGGMMTTGFAGVIQWYYGSSSGSAMKDEALAKTAAAQTETLAKTAAAQTETIQAQSTALAASMPAQVTTTNVDAGAGTAETVTEPAAPEEKRNA